MSAKTIEELKEQARRTMVDASAYCAGVDAAAQLLVGDGFNDLRGRSVREIHRDDAVIITGEEYLRKSWAAREWAEVEAERGRA